MDKFVLSTIIILISVSGSALGSSPTEMGTLCTTANQRFSGLLNLFDDVEYYAPKTEMNERLCTFVNCGGAPVVQMLENIQASPSVEAVSILGNLLADDGILKCERFSKSLLDLALLVEPDVRIREIWSRFKSFGQQSLSLGVSFRRIKDSNPDVCDRIMNLVSFAGDASLGHLLQGITAIANSIDTITVQPDIIDDLAFDLTQNIRELLLASVLHRDIFALRNLVSLPRNLRDIKAHLSGSWNTTIAPLIPDLSKFVLHCIEDDEESITPVLEFTETIHTIAERGRLIGWDPVDPSMDTLINRNLNEWVRKSIEIDPSSNLADSFARWTPIDFLNGAGLGDAMDYIRPRDIAVYDFILQASHPNVRGWEDEEVVSTVGAFAANISQISVASDFVIPNVYDAYETDPADLAIAYVRTALLWGILHGHFDFKDLLFLCFLRKSNVDLIASRLDDDNDQAVFEDILLTSGEYARLFLVEEYLPVTPISLFLKKFNMFVTLTDNPSELASHVTQLADSIRVYIESSGIQIGTTPALSPVSHRYHGLGPEVVPFGILNMYGNYLTDLAWPVFTFSDHEELVAVSDQPIAHLEFIPSTTGRFLRIVMRDNSTVIHDLNHETSVSLISPSFRLYPTERIAIDYDDDRVIFWFPTYRLPRELFLAPDEYLVVGFTDPVFEYERGFTIVVVTKSLRSKKFFGTTLHVSAYGSSYTVNEFELSDNVDEIELIGNAVFVDGLYFCEAVSNLQKTDRYALSDLRDKQQAFLRRFTAVGDQIFFDGTLMVELGIGKIIEPLEVLVEDKYAVLVVRTDNDSENQNPSTVLVDVETKWSPKTGLSP